MSDAFFLASLKCSFRRLRILLGDIIDVTSKADEFLKLCDKIQKNNKWVSFNDVHINHRSLLHENAADSLLLSRECCTSFHKDLACLRTLYFSFRESQCNSPNRRKIIKRLILLGQTLNTLKQLITYLKIYILPTVSFIHDEEMKCKFVSFMKEPFLRMICSLNVQIDFFLRKIKVIRSSSNMTLTNHGLPFLKRYQIHAIFQFDGKDLNSFS